MKKPTCDICGNMICGHEERILDLAYLERPPLPPKPSPDINYNDNIKPEKVVKSRIAGREVEVYYTEAEDLREAHEWQRTH